MAVEHTATSFFVTGTDTGIGKTLTTVALMQSFRAAGHHVYGMKPVASGCRMTSAGLVSDDALLIQKYCSEPLPYNLINPVALENPASPNIAAALEARECLPERIFHAYTAIREKPGHVFIEGIGGWRTPFCGALGMADFVRLLDVPVILVVGLRLGCINHALLTLEVLQHDGVTIQGWIANQSDPDYQYSGETISYLISEISVPLLGEIPYLYDNNADAAGAFIDPERLLNKHI